ncbi:MAG: chromosomal replication initiator protein DnaA [Acidobacteria bacterium]|nr:chromosomal replication initiator protein DnaA [Acidobacteriota bacterium]
MNIWNSLLSKIAENLDQQSFNTWFRPTHFLGEKGDTIFVEVPSKLYKDWLNEKYGRLIESALNEIGKGGMRVSFILKKEAGKEDDTGRSSLNPRYTFDTFVVGSSNQLAHAACRSVAETPSRSYNPLFIYGGVGLGKTHLLHAIGNYILTNKPDLRVVYISSEKFMNELINSIRYDKTPAFRERYRKNIDILLMDDIQFLAGKERTQEEFFHTFNALYDSQKQIVLTSDSPPREIPTLEERLRSRFEWGLIADIQPPDLETKIAILEKKAEIEGVKLPDDVLFFIASNVKSNIRELEGCLIRLIAFSSLTGSKISLELAKEVLRDVLTLSEQKVSISKIKQFIADYYHLKVYELTAKNNSKRVAFPRQIAMYLAKELTNASLPEIGREFGGKHHSTVIHSIRKIQSLKEKDQNFNKLINTFISSLEGG